MAAPTPIPVPIAARVAAIDGTFTLTAEQQAFMALVCQAMSEAANKIVAGLPPTGQFDVGRVIAGIDAMQHSKDVLCMAAVLPAYKP